MKKWYVAYTFNAGSGWEYKSHEIEADTFNPVL